MISNHIVRPRALSHRGVVMASGWWVDPLLCGADEARRRILSHWESGARVFETGGGYLLQFTSPRLLHVETAPGVLVVEHSGWLLGAPLMKSEWEALQQSEIRFSPHKLVLARDGALFHPTEALPVDVSLWLDVEAWESEDMVSLGEAMPLSLAVPAAEFEARRALDVPASPELMRFLAQMRGEELAESSSTPWWERLFSKRNNGDGGTLFKNSFGIQRIGVLLANLFQFGFGAGGDAPPLRRGEHFLSEFGIVARYFGVAVLLVLLFCALCGSQAGLAGAISLSLKLLSVLVIGAVLSWGLLVFSRLFPTPPHVAMKNAMPSPNRGAGIIPFDLVGFLLLCCCLFIYSLLQQNWLWVLITLAVSIGVALQVHWELRRSGQADYEPRSGIGAGFGAFFSRLFGGKAGDGDVSSPAREPKPRSGWLKSMLWQTELARLFGARQARYMMRMMQMFERGDLDAALKHAVPFNLFSEGASHPMLGVPRPRADLDFLGGRSVGGAGIPLPVEIKELLTKHYRAAHETLAAQNRIDEAAFVLAELLDSPQEAVQYLEKNQSWRKAAQLCEARGLEAGLAVRLWWLAGERNRAVVVARRSGAFADAVLRLESAGEKHRDDATALRLIWAHSLALTGDYAGAVEVAWPVIRAVPDASTFIGVWVERGLEGTGSAAARMLGRQGHILSNLNPQAIENWRERVSKLLDDTEEESVGLRLQFAGLLGSAPSHGLARAAARRAIRALTRDAARFPHWSKELQEHSKKLLEFANDGSLRTDWSALSFPPATSLFINQADPLLLRVEADDVGSLHIHDAAYLSDGRVLVALGEAGARLLNPKAQTSANFDQPCHRLVMSTSDERAIGVALRGLDIAMRFSEDEVGLKEFIATMGVREYNKRAGMARLCRFDLTRKSVTAWGELAELNAFSSRLDSSQWIISNSDAISSLDTSASGPLALWRTGKSGYAESLGADSNSLAMTTRFYNPRGSHREVWRFDLPSLMLRERRLLPVDGQESNRYFTTPNGILLSEKSGEGNDISISKFTANIGPLEMPAGEKALQVEVCGNWLVVLSRSGDDSIVRLMKWYDIAKALKGKIRLCNSGSARFRLTETTLTLVDSRGRLIVLDLTSGAILRNSRLY